MKTFMFESFSDLLRVIDEYVNLYGSLGFRFSGGKDNFAKISDKIAEDRLRGVLHMVGVPFEEEDYTPIRVFIVRSLEEALYVMKRVWHSQGAFERTYIEFGIAPHGEQFSVKVLGEDRDDENFFRHELEICAIPFEEVAAKDYEPA